MKKIKICHIITAHKRYDIRVFKKECVSLARKGYDVTLLTSDGLEEEVVDEVKIKSVDITTGAWWLKQGLWMIDGKKRKSKDVSLLNRIQRELFTHKYMLKDALSVNAEIYHIHEPSLLSLGVKLKQHGKKVIFDSHENYPEQIKAITHIPFLLRNIISAVYKYYETRLARKLDAVIIPCTINEGINFFENRSKKTAIVSNVPILAEFYDLYNGTATRKDNRTLCLIGGLSYNRGLTYLIKAVYKARAKLILAGTFFPLGYREELEKMPEYECVDYRGPLGREEVLEVYEESSIGVATSLYVGQYNTGDILATKVYECMSMGLPVIITRFPYVDKINSKYEFAITVNPSDVDEIAIAIQYLMENPEKAHQMGMYGRKAIKERFNWDIEEKKLFEVYGQLYKKDG